MIPTDKNIAQAKAIRKTDIRKIDNNLIENAIKDASAQTLKVIFYLAHELEGEREKIPDTGVLYVTVSLDDMEQYTGIKDTTLRQRLRHMQKTTITWISDDGNIERDTSLLPEIERDHTHRTAKLTIFSKIAKMIIDVPKHIGGTMLNVKDIARLKSKHAIRLVPLLHRINNYNGKALKQKVLDLDELNAFFGVKKRSIYQMEQEIIKPLYEELQGNAKMAFEYEVQLGYTSTIRRGRPKALGILIRPKPRTRVQQTLL